MPKKSDRGAIKPRLVLAIDPAKAAGIAVFLDGQLAGYAEADGSSWTSMAPVIKGLVAAYADIPDNQRHCTIEEGFGLGKGAKTLDRRRGIAQASAESAGFHSFMYLYPSTWQNSTFGPIGGRDTKALSTAYVRDRFQVEGVSHDVADAISIGAYVVGEHD